METSLTTLRGLGQIMFQRNAATGLLFLIGIAANSLLMALAALAGSIGGAEYARYRKFSSQDISDGLYGFNAALVAIGAVFFYPTPFSAVLVGIGGIVLCTELMHIMHKHALKPFTFPFIVTLWLAFAILPQGETLSANDTRIFLAPLDGFFQGFGQVMFQGNTFTGLLFLVAILISSVRHAWLASLAAALGYVVADGFGFSSQASAGLYGYNAVLTAIAVSLFSTRTLHAITGAALSILITWLMLNAHLPALTFPFVLATWLVVGFIQLREKQLQHETQLHHEKQLHEKQKAPPNEPTP
ncbi:Urea transporter [gamma proteobacterium HdN1]|nr:Urea transporter [gamma proteobacterium HdN1]